MTIAGGVRPDDEHLPKQLQDVFPTVQIVLKLHRSAAEVLAMFDLPCCETLYSFEKNEVYWTEIGKIAFQTRTNVVDPVVALRSASYNRRARKYAGRGFALYVPGFEMNLITSNYHLWHKDETDLVGIQTLLFEIKEGPILKGFNIDSYGHSDEEYKGLFFSTIYNGSPTPIMHTCKEVPYHIIMPVLKQGVPGVALHEDLKKSYDKLMEPGFPNGTFQDPLNKDNRLEGRLGFVWDCITPELFVARPRLAWKYWSMRYNAMGLDTNSIILYVHPESGSLRSLVTVPRKIQFYYVKNTAELLKVCGDKSSNKYGRSLTPDEYVKAAYGRY